jgi:hypothetical protein
MDDVAASSDNMVAMMEEFIPRKSWQIRTFFTLKNWGSNVCQYTYIS